MTSRRCLTSAPKTLGGETGEWYEVRDLSTPLGGRVRSVGETPYVGSGSNDWWQYSTEVDFYAPRISALAKPLTHELRDYFMGSGAQTLSLDGFDEAYYAKNASGDTQFLHPAPRGRGALLSHRGGR